MKETFENKVRKIIKDHAGKSIKNLGMIAMLGIKTKAEKQSLYNALVDLRKSGEIIRIKKGEYKWLGKKADPQLREIMWHILRARKNITIEDMQELSGAAELYVREWLRMLCARGIVKKTGSGKYSMIKDPVIMPGDDKKADRLRKMRKQKKIEALAALTAADLAIKKARLTIEGME